MRLKKLVTSQIFVGTGTLVEAVYYDVSLADIASVAMRNLSGGAITAFQIRVNPTMSDTRAPILIKSSNFLVPDATIVHCSADPTNLIVGNSTIIDIDVSYRSQLRLYVNAPLNAQIEFTAGMYSYEGS